MSGHILFLIEDINDYRVELAPLHLLPFSVRISVFKLLELFLVEIGFLKVLELAVFLDRLNGFEGTFLAGLDVGHFLGLYLVGMGKIIVLIIFRPKLLHGFLHILF